MKKTIVVLSFALSLAFNSFTQPAQRNTYSNESFTFPIEKGKKHLNGTLSIPVNYKDGDAVVVLVTPPTLANRDYLGLFSSLADTLARSGIATLRYDNRAFSDSINLPRDQSQFTMFDISSDAHDAYLAIRKDTRFTKASIGLIGHSEGGAAAAIECSRNIKINFLVVLSTPGISGEIFAYNQKISAFEIPMGYLPAKQRNAIASLFYYPIHLIAKYSNNKVLRKKLIQYTKNKYLSTPTNELKKEYGIKTMQQVIESNISYWLKPHTMELIRFNPNLYYPKINCPTLAVCGKKDEVLDWKQNLYGLERIFLEKGKNNYTIIAKDSLNHSFQTVTKDQIPAWMHGINSKNVGDQRGKGYKELCNSIIEWIHQNSR